MANDTVEKKVKILMEIMGSEEAKKKAGETLDTASEGMDRAKESAETAGPKIDSFMDRWGKQLAAIAGAITGLWVLSRYSDVASSYMNIFGAGIGYIANLILIRLLPAMIWLNSVLIQAGNLFASLPEPIQDVTAYIIALTIAYAALKKLGIITLGVNLAGSLSNLGWIIPTLDSLMLSGGLGGAAVFIGALSAGIGLGLAGVWVLIETGVIDWIQGIGATMEEYAPWLNDVLRTIFAYPALIGVAAIDIVSGRFDQLGTDLINAFTSIKNGIFNVFIWPLLTGINLVIDGMNLISGLAGIEIPSIDIEGLRSLMVGSEIPTYATGGKVRKTGLAIVDEGETISRGNEGVNSGTTVQYITITGQWANERELFQKFSQELARGTKRLS